MFGGTPLDGHTLVVTGNSQGGLQAIVTAALNPKVTAVLTLVPAGCDMNGPLAQRQAGWPGWYWASKGRDAAEEFVSPTAITTRLISPRALNALF